MAIPVVLVFCGCAMILFMGMFSFRQEARQQNLVNFNYLQAAYLAEAATNHFLFKTRLLPREATDAGSLEQGFCPFWVVSSNDDELPTTPGIKNRSGTDIFLRDCRTSVLPWLVQGFSGPRDAPFQADQWTYAVTEAKFVSAFADKENDQLVNVAVVTAEGSVNDLRGKRGKRTEVVKKTIEVRRPLVK
jgi:hypothetical protein